MRVGEMPELLKGRVAIVTGAGRGIGMATARTLHGAGARVLVADLEAETTEAVVSALGPGAVGFAGDLLRADVPDTMVATAIDAFGALDIVVNNAGFHWDAPVHRMTDEQYETVLAIHGIVPFRVLRAAAPHLRDAAKRDLEQAEERFRKVVNVSSVAASFGNAGAANYSAGKAAMIGLTKALAKEWGHLKINVNAVAFGGIATRFMQPRSAENVVRLGERVIPLGAPQAVFEQLSGGADYADRDVYDAQELPNVPLGRSGTIQEAADAIFYLCSPLSNYVHGQVLVVSGGMPLGMTS
jgi:3-oxoacyl-[acyl-carrier protein] reductase